MRPKSEHFPEAFVIEFKSVGDKEDLEAAVQAAFTQIEAKAYAAQLQQAGVAEAQIHKLAIVIQGKQVRLQQA